MRCTLWGIARERWSGLSGFRVKGGLTYVGSRVRTRGLELGCEGSPGCHIAFWGSS